MSVGPRVRSYHLLVSVALFCHTHLAETVKEDQGADDANHEHCLSTAFPQNRSGFPAFLNCLGLHAEAVEVGVQAGVHASSFLQAWKGRRLRLVDTWGKLSDGASKSQVMYVDIANIAGADSGRQHRTHCEERLADELHTGRAEIVNLDSSVAAASVPDGELDFVYLDARHDFAGVVADIHAWWPKVKAGGVFAGHDFVDGEFPEGDFFWLSALQAVLPEVAGHTQVTLEKDRYPSFFVMKSGALAGTAPRVIQADIAARRLYAGKSRYFKLWQQLALDAGSGSHGEDFLPLCGSACGQDCRKRAHQFTPTSTVGSTLRPFACGHAGGSLQPQLPTQSTIPAAPDQCAGEMVIDAHAYLNVCLERCNVTCQQRGELFSNLGAEISSA